MISVYRDNTFEKCLDYLKRTGGSGAAAARRAEALIAELINSDGRTRPETCRMTRNGEARIRHCRKYDLGEGHRLVCIRRGNRLVLLYAGSHDDCDRWLERNRGLRPELGTGQVVASPVGRPARPTPVAYADEEPGDDYEEGIARRITASDLRMLFRGFWEK